MSTLSFLALLLSGLAPDLSSSPPAPVELSATAMTAKDPMALRLRAIQPDHTAITIPWPEKESIRWLYIRVSGTQENRDSTNLGQPDSDGAQRLMPPAPGTALIGLDLRTTADMWSADQANQFAQLCRSEPHCFQDSIRVLHTFSATTIIPIGANPTEPSLNPNNTAATSKSGQASELRPLMDPTAIRGGDLALRAYVSGEGVAGATLTAVHIPSRTVQTVHTDAKGIGIINLNQAGPWRVAFHTLHPVDDHWQATSCTLTFNAQGADAGQISATLPESEPTTLPTSTPEAKP